MVKKADAPLSELLCRSKIQRKVKIIIIKAGAIYKGLEKCNQNPEAHVGL